MRVALAALALLAATVVAGAEDQRPPIRVEATDRVLAVELTVMPPNPEIGQQIDLVLRATLQGAREGARVEWPDVRGELTEALGEDVVEVTRARPGRGDESYTAELRLYDAGRFEFPALAVRAVGADDEELGSVELGGVALEVPSVLPAGKVTPTPLRDALEWEEPSRLWIWLLGVGAVGFLGLLVLIAFLLLRGRRREASPTAAPTQPAHERALVALSRLLSRNLPEQGRVEPYFVELSEILRRYLEDRFGLRAPEQTTEEFLADVGRTAAGRRAIHSAHRDLLRGFLTRADLVKFARDEPDVSVCHDAAAAARSFVTETRPPAAATEQP